MNSYKQKIRENFSTSAKRYNTWATSQEKAAEILIKKITKKNPATVLDIGCGTGILTAKLLKKFTTVKITGLDFAPKMITLCQQKWPTQQFICTDAEEFESNQTYDLITSSFTFQWFAELAATIYKYWQLLAVNGEMAIALPLAGSLAELRSASIKANKKLLPLHNLPTEKEFTKIITQLPGCQLEFCQEKELVSYYPSPVAALHPIKKIGAVYKTKDNYNYQEMKSLLNSYPSKTIDNKIVYPLTYNVLFIIVKKKSN